MVSVLYYLGNNEDKKSTLVQYRPNFIFKYFGLWLNVWMMKSHCMVQRPLAPVCILDQFCPKNTSAVVKQPISMLHKLALVTCCYSVFEIW